MTTLDFELRTLRLPIAQTSTLGLKGSAGVLCVAEAPKATKGLQV